MLFKHKRIHDGEHSVECIMRGNTTGQFQILTEKVFMHCSIFHHIVPRICIRDSISNRNK